MMPINHLSNGDATLDQQGQSIGFCDACDTLLTGPVIFCSTCGHKVESQVEVDGDVQRAPQRRPAVQEAVKLPSAPRPEADVFSSQVRLIHRHHDQAKRLQRSVAREARKINALLTHGRKAELRPQLAALSERVLELEQSWEEIQCTYNRQSQAVEEDYLAQASGRKAEVELTPDLRQALQEELEAFLGTLEDVGDTISDLSQKLELQNLRRASRFVDLRLQGAMPVFLVLVVMVCSLGLSAFLGLRAGLSLSALAAILALPAAGLFAMGCLFLYRQSPPGLAS